MQLKLVLLRKSDTNPTKRTYNTVPCSRAVSRSASVRRTRSLYSCVLVGGEKHTNLDHDALLSRKMYVVLYLYS